MNLYLNTPTLYLRFFRLNLLAALLLFLMMGCGKKGGGGPSSSDYYVKFKVDGQQYTFKGYPYATFTYSDDMYLIGVGGFKEEGVGTKNAASILVGSLTEIKEGTYSGLIHPPSGGAAPTVFIAYIDQNGKTFSNLYKDNATNTVTITSLNETSVKGHFSGKIYDVVNQENTPHEYSGDFFVKRVN